MGTSTNTRAKRKRMKSFRAWAIVNKRGKVPLFRPNYPILCIGRRHLGDCLASSTERVIKVLVSEIE